MNASSLQGGAFGMRVSSLNKVKLFLLSYHLLLLVLLLTTMLLVG
jgi:hypothetical protein